MEMEKGFSKIAPDVRVYEKKQDKTAEIKVAAYCRVSTDLEEQEQSLETQIEAYSRIIQEHPGWALAGIYADKGISGTSVKNRKEFLRMIEDAKAGKIQYILAKAVSRFARNTVDTLTYVRELRSCGVNVYFEEENLDTGDVISEFVLSVLAASAQEEIISLSNNLKVGRRMRFAAGVVQWSNLYGYRLSKKGWVIEEGEAQIIRRIFDEYLSGKPYVDMCKELEKEGIPSPGGKKKWHVQTILDILHNEKYMGDVRMQKTYVSDPIQHIQLANKDATVRQYYKEDHHVPIIDRITFTVVQMSMAMKPACWGTSQYPFYSFLKCPVCGAKMVKFQRIGDHHLHGWTCGGQHSEKGNLRKDRTKCPPFFFPSETIEDAYREASGLPEDTPVELKELVERVMEITFPDWTHMSVHWRDGKTTKVELKFKFPTYHPLPTISKETVEKQYGEHKRKRYIHYVNGQPFVHANSGRMVDSVRKNQEEVLNLMILDPEPYEQPIPHVYGSKSPRRETEAQGETQKKEKWKQKTKGRSRNNSSRRAAERRAAG